jgi:predicted DNA-binding transcriptional regulator AlpA
MHELETVTESPLLLRASQAAQLCGISERTWRTWDHAGRIPSGITIAKSKYWRRRELEAWVQAGCPDRETWNTLKSEE